MESFTLHGRNFYDKDTGVTTTDVYLGNYGLYIGKTDGSKWKDILILDNEHSIERVQGMDGGYFFGRTYKERKIEIPCFFEGLGNTGVKNLQEILSFKTPLKLCLDQHPYRYIWVIPEGQHDFEYYRGDYYWGLVTVKFVAYDPFWYSWYNSLEVIDFVYDDPKLYYDSGILYTDEFTNRGILYPAMFSNISQVQNFKLYNGGNAPAKMIVKVQGSCTNMTLTNSTTGKSCSVSSMTGNETTWINGYKGRITDSQELVLKTSIFSGDFIEVMPGENNMLLTANAMNLYYIHFDYNYTYI